MDTYPGEIFLTCNEFVTKILNKFFDTIFQSAMNHFNDYYNFVINEYKAAWHNFMRYEGFIKCDQISHRDFKILD